MATNRTGRWRTSTRNATGRRTSTSSYSSTTRPAPGYTSVYNNFNNKISSYKFLTAQTTGTAKSQRPTAASLNSFGKWIEKGAIVHRVSGTQLRKWSHTTQQFKTTASAKNCIQNRFGKGPIKAVIPNKTGGFLVATAPVWKGKSFKFPS